VSGTAAVLELASIPGFRRRQIGDLYVHQVDLAHFLMGIDDPVSAVAAGGVLHYKDGRTAPDNIALAVQYANGCVITYEGSVVPGARGRGLQFFGSEGGLRIDSELPGGPFFLPPGRGKPVPVASGGGGDSTADHVKNFLECMRSRKLPQRTYTSATAARRRAAGESSLPGATSRQVRPVRKRLCRSRWPAATLGRKRLRRTAPIMLRFIVLVTVAIFACCAQAPQGVWKLPDQLAEPEWLPLFNGKDLGGWARVGNDDWKAENGAIHGWEPQRKAISADRAEV